MKYNNHKYWQVLVTWKKYRSCASREQVLDQGNLNMQMTRVLGEYIIKYKRQRKMLAHGNSWEIYI